MRTNRRPLPEWLLFLAALHGCATGAPEEGLDTPARAALDAVCPSEEHPWEGRCDGLGELLYYCTDEGPAVWDCAQQGLACGPDPTGRAGFVCVAPPVDRCRHVGTGGDGLCEADEALVLCEGGDLLEVDCAAGGLVCLTVGMRADCFAPPFEPCGDVGPAGRCRGALLVWCEPGDVLAGRSCRGRGTATCVEEDGRARCE
jgi:hypothetical protein